MKNCFLNIGGRIIKCIRFANDMALLAEDGRMLKDMLMELNDRCEDYLMKININKTKTMVIGIKPKKIDMRIKDESLEQMGSFKYLACYISSNLISEDSSGRRSCKRSIFCGPLEKELRKRLVKCIVWSVVIYGAESWTLRRNEQK